MPVGPVGSAAPLAGPGQLTDLAGLARTGRTGRAGLGSFGGPEGSGSPRGRKTGGGGERNDENTAVPGSRGDGCEQVKDRARSTKHSRPATTKPQGKITGQRLCRIKTKYHQNNKQAKH